MEDREMTIAEMNAQSAEMMRQVDKKIVVSETLTRASQLRCIEDQLAREAAMILCSCGHRASRSHVMNTGRGTTCPACYDRMSE
jgi:hypothetical protein